MAMFVRSPSGKLSTFFVKLSLSELRIAVSYPTSVNANCSKVALSVGPGPRLGDMTPESRVLKHDFYHPKRVIKKKISLIHSL